jgi:phosphatidylinositol alpha-mannosyltransferase
MVSYRLPAPGEKRGGVDKVAHDLSDGLARRGHEVTVWSYDPKPEDAAYNVRPLPWRRFARSKLGFRFNGGYVGNLINILPRYDADLLIVNGDSLLVPLLRKPLIRIMHGSALGEALSASHPLRFLLQLGVYPQELLAALLQRGCVGVSESCRRYNPFLRNIVPLGVDSARFVPAVEKKTVHPSILFVGTLRGRKRGDFLLAQFTRYVRPRFPSARLMMVTEPGPPVEGVCYFTGVGQEELIDLYQKAWVYASPSTYEGFGLPYLEAMACGTPVIATPNPGSRELLGKSEFGLLASDADFATGLCTLLSDSDARGRLTASGLARAQEYSLEKMLDRYEALIEKLRVRTVHANAPASH